MAKEKKFKSGKKRRKKKGVHKEKFLWNQQTKKHLRRKAKKENRERKENWNDDSVPVPYPRKKKNIITIDDYIAWNRAQTTGLTQDQLIKVVEVTNNGHNSLIETDMEVDYSKVEIAKKEKHIKNLKSILNKLP